MDEKSERNILSRAYTGMADILSPKKPKDTRVPLPEIALVADANITDTWEAVERFPACLVLTDPILSNETENYTVKEVIFNIKSNDQGWCNEDNFEGQFEGSWTWFEVAILRPVKQGVRISPRDKQSINSEPFIKKYLEEQKISNRLCFFINPEEGTPFWHLQRNRRGNSEPWPHKVTWKKDSKKSESESLGWDFNAEDGSGSGVGFVNSLKKNDRVVLIARAKQSGSVNYISEAKFQILFEGFEDPPTAGPTQVTNPEQSETAAQSDVPSADTTTAHGDPSLGERRTSNSTLQSSIAKSTQPDVRQPYLDVPGPTASPLPSSPTRNNVNPQLPRATNFEAEGVQAEDKTQQAIVEGGTDGTTANSKPEISRPPVPSDAPDTGPSDANAGPPVPPKTPTKQSRKGSNGNSRWNLPSIPGRKKKSTSNLEPNSATGNGTQAQSESKVGTSPPINNDQAGPPAPDDSSTRTQPNPLTTPSSSAREKPKSLLGGWSDKVNFRVKRGKTPSKSLADDVDKVDDSEAGGAA